MVVTALTMAFSFLCGCNPVLEQPLGSVMPKEEPLKFVLQAIGASKWVIYHGAYSAESRKPLQFWSPADLSSLVRPCPSHLHSDLTIRGVKRNRDGSIQYDAKGRPKKSWTGNRSKLKASQTYCEAFARQVAALVLEWLKDHLSFCVFG